MTNLMRPPFSGCRGLRLPPIPAGSVLYCPARNDAYGSKLTDESGYGNHGTITGATWTRLPRLWGLSFDGDDYVDCGNNISLQTTNNLTGGMWFKTPATLATETGAAWANGKSNISKYTTTGDQRSWLIGRGASVTLQTMNKLYIALGDPVDGTFEYRGYYNSNLLVSTWYHSVITFASGTLILYMNGVAVTLTTVIGAVPATLWNSTANLLLMANNAGTSGLSSGIVALPIIGATTVWTAAQVLNDYNQTRSLVGA